MQPFPKIIDPNIDSHQEALLQISRYREQDITDRNTFNSIFLNGRKVGKVPSSSLDVASTDKLGDFNVTNAYAYWLINNAGAAEWRRVAVASW